MSEPGHKRGRAHDAEGAREAILNAAEEVFAKHGFDGARIDAIAKVAGYNKSLIFQYYGDKLGLYGEVIRRADLQMSELQNQFIAIVAEDETASDPHRFEALLRAGIGAYFDYLVEHPRIGRIYNWELAEGWQTFAKIVSQKDYDDLNRFGLAMSKVQHAELLRPGMDPVLSMSTVLFLSQLYLSIIPLFELLVPGTDYSSGAALASAREYIIEFIIHGLMRDPVETMPPKDGTSVRKK